MARLVCKKCGMQFVGAFSSCPACGGAMRAAAATKPTGATSSAKPAPAPPARDLARDSVPTEPLRSDTRQRVSRGLLAIGAVAALVFVTLKVVDHLRDAEPVMAPSAGPAAPGDQVAPPSEDRVVGKPSFRFTRAWVEHNTQGEHGRLARGAAWGSQEMLSVCSTIEIRNGAGLKLVVSCRIFDSNGRRVSFRSGTTPYHCETTDGQLGASWEQDLTKNVEPFNPYILPIPYMAFDLPRGVKHSLVAKITARCGDWVHQTETPFVLLLR